ncbi:MAG: TlpA disulfide reductase family protein [Chloroflexota bacterium]
MKRALWGVVFALPLISLLWFGLNRNPNAAATPLVHKPAPNFTLRSLDGRQVSLARLRGTPVVLNFWASWCADCKVEHPYIVQLERYFARRGVKFFGVSYQDGEGSARSFLRTYGVAWPDLRDPGQRTAIDYGVTGVPETFVIDRHGILQFHSPGPVTPNAPTTPDVLAQQITRALGSRA